MLRIVFHCALATLFLSSMNIRVEGQSGCPEAQIVKVCRTNTDCSGVDCLFSVFLVHTCSPSAVFQVELPCDTEVKFCPDDCSLLSSIAAIEVPARARGFIPNRYRNSSFAEAGFTPPADVTFSPVGTSINAPIEEFRLKTTVESGGNPVDLFVRLARVKFDYYNEHDIKRGNGEIGIAAQVANEPSVGDELTLAVPLTRIGNSRAFIIRDNARWHYIVYTNIDP